jgi:hypothetical protein
MHARVQHANAVHAQHAASAAAARARHAQSRIPQGVAGIMHGNGAQ